MTTSYVERRRCLLSCTVTTACGPARFPARTQQTGYTIGDGWTKRTVSPRRARQQFPHGLSGESKEFRESFIHPPPAMIEFIFASASSHFIIMIYLVLRAFEEFQRPLVVMSRFLRLLQGVDLYELFRDNHEYIQSDRFIMLIVWWRKTVF